jgi:hypothetical protein
VTARLRLDTTHLFLPAIGTRRIGRRTGAAATRIPELVARLTRAMVWAWPDVEAWARKTGRLPA